MTSQQSWLPKIESYLLINDVLPMSLPPIITANRVSLRFWMISGSKRIKYRTTVETSGDASEHRN